MGLIVLVQWLALFRTWHELTRYLDDEFTTSDFVGHLTGLQRRSRYLDIVRTLMREYFTPFIGSIRISRSVMKGGISCVYLVYL
jgi:hypothetical protein